MTMSFLGKLAATIASVLAISSLYGCSSCSSDEEAPPPGDCTAGAQGCACKPGNTCDFGLACTAGKCAAAPSAGLSVSNPAARGCEVLLVEHGATVQTITFDDTVKGTFVREAPRVAVSFVSAKDTAIAQGSVKVVLAGGGTAAGVTVQQVNCVDVAAAPLAGVEVSVTQ